MDSPFKSLTNIKNYGLYTRKETIVNVTEFWKIILMGVSEINRIFLFSELLLRHGERQGHVLVLYVKVLVLYLSIFTYTLPHAWLLIRPGNRFENISTIFL